jgi:hypothetical protein
MSFIRFRHILPLGLPFWTRPLGGLMRHRSRRTAIRARSALVAGVVSLAAPVALTAATQTASSAQPAGGTAAISPRDGVTPQVPATADNPTNPLAGRSWGVYKGPGDQAWAPYESSTGAERQLLAKIALRPKAKWFGQWISEADIATKVRGYIEKSTLEDPGALVQLTDFRLKPWEHNACKQLPTEDEQAGYKGWTDQFAQGIAAGLRERPGAEVAVILQPDGPFALCAPNGSTLPSHLIGYAAKELADTGAMVYIDAGASDWLRDDPARAYRILRYAGIEYARGFAFNSTHYVSTGRDIRFGAKVVAELASHGIADKHFVVNTSSNGKPFAGYTYTGPNFDNARVCASPSDSRCVTLGIPPTADVANPKWGMSATTRALASKYVDGFLWFGRPWLYMQADPFDMKRALALARTTPW